MRPLVPAGHGSRLHRPRARRHRLDDEPASAARNKTESSIVVGLKLVHDGEADAFVSAGNTGAVVAGSLLYVRRITGVQRPAICTHHALHAGADRASWTSAPTPSAAPSTCASSPSWARRSPSRSWASPQPTVGLLSIGEEPEKGTPAVIEAHQLIAADERIRFYGNVEGRDIMNRLVDVVVTDGFTGNVALKTIEGSARGDPGRAAQHDRHLG